MTASSTVRAQGPRTGPIRGASNAKIKRVLRRQPAYPSWIDASKTPGLQYVAVNADEIVRAFHGGWADIRQQRPMGTATTLMAYSMSKTITAHVLGRLGIPSRAMSYTVADAAWHATGYLEKYSALNLVKGLLVDRTLVGEYAGRWLEIRGHFPNGLAFGGLVGTAQAFAVFLQDQLRPRSVLLGQAARALLHQPQQTRDGATSVLMTNATGLDVGKALDVVDGA